MFSNARQLYILEKGENPSMKQALVESISQPTPKYQTTYIPAAYGQPMEMVVDIKAKAGEEPMEFKQLPAGQGVCTYGNVIVTDSRDAMNAEIENTIRSSRAILDSAQMHRNIIEHCNRFLMELNPQYAKEQKQEERIGGMETRMSGMENSLAKIQEMMAAFMDKLQTT